MEIARRCSWSLATVATAWSSYQASRWHGEQAEAQSRATAKRARVDACLRCREPGGTRSTSRSSYSGSTRDSKATPKLAAFYRVALHGPVQAGVPGLDRDEAARGSSTHLPTPFAMPQYKVAESRRGRTLRGAGDGCHPKRRRRDIQRADNYVLAVVLFAASLFFGGLSLRLRTDTARTAILGCGYLHLRRVPRSGSPPRR